MSTAAMEGIARLGDFAALTPQVATSGNGTGNGLSAAGMNTRFNTIQIDGANNTDLYAIASGKPDAGMGRV